MLVSLSPPKEAEVEEPEAQAEDAQEDNELPEEISDHDDDDDDISGSNSEDDMILASQMPKKDEGWETSCQNTLKIPNCHFRKMRMNPTHHYH